MWKIVASVILVLALVSASSSDVTTLIRRPGIPLTDWCPANSSITACIAAWNMDQDSGAIRVATGGDCDAAGTDCDLDLDYANVEKDTSDYVEGTGSAEFDPGEIIYLHCADTDCDELDGNASKGLTWGGWFLIDSDAAVPYPIYNISGNYGYSILRNATAKDVRCRVGDGTDWIAANGTDNDWTPNVWHHVVCKHDGSTTITAYFNGVAQGTAAQSPIAADTGDFYVDTATTGSGGNADEVFVYDAVLDDVEVCRIARCGMNGNLCMCDVTDPTTFKSCSVDANCRIPGNTTALCNVTDSKCTGRAGYTCSLTGHSCNAAAPT